MLHVTSEVGRLRQVMVHAPGPEIDQMTPDMMEELLFDDILYGDLAREEHSCLREVFRQLGVEWLDSRDLLAESLEHPEARQWLFEVLFVHAAPRTQRQVQEASAEELAEALVGGIRTSQTGADLDPDALFELPPVPNWCFQRDPQVVIGQGVLFSAMATAARWRETILSRAIFQFHPVYRATASHDLSTGRPPGFGLCRPSFEGGDFLVVSPDVLLIGFSERTNITGIRQVAQALAPAARAGTAPRHAIVVRLPQQRAYMHLDTLLTAVDRDACLVFPPVILEGGAEIYEIDLCSEDFQPQSRTDLFATLRTHGLDWEPISCGGSDRLHQQREQWTDGANAFALAPGVITTYDRNIRTVEELSKRGFRIVKAEELIDPEVSEAVDLERGERVCIVLSSNELSRARGGPHCLTQPLLRDD